MKKEMIVLAMALGMVAALSASGNQDDEAQAYGRGPGMGRGFDEERQEQRLEEREAWLEEQETVSLTGSLQLVNGELPFIESDGVKYVMMAPWYAVEDIELTDGMEVTVEGIKMPARNLQWDETEVTLMLTKAVVNGEEIEIDHPADGQGRMGGRMKGGRQGGKGNGGGRMMGRG